MSQQMQVNYYEAGDWVGGHIWAKDRAVRHAISAYQWAIDQGDYSIQRIARLGRGYPARNAGVYIKLRHEPTGRLATITIEPTAPAPCADDDATCADCASPVTDCRCDELATWNVEGADPHWPRDDSRPCLSCHDAQHDAEAAADLSDLPFLDVTVIQADCDALSQRVQDACQFCGERAVGYYLDDGSPVCTRCIVTDNRPQPVQDEDARLADHIANGNREDRDGARPRMQHYFTADRIARIEAMAAALAQPVQDDAGKYLCVFTHYAGGGTYTEVFSNDKLNHASMYAQQESVDHTRAKVEVVAICDTGQRIIETWKGGELNAKRQWIPFAKSAAIAALALVALALPTTAHAAEVPAFVTNVPTGCVVTAVYEDHSALAVCAGGYTVGAGEEMVWHVH